MSIPHRPLSPTPEAAKPPRDPGGSDDAAPHDVSNRRWGVRLATGSFVVLALAAGPACGGRSPVGPTANDLTGTWSGSSSYPNAPFQLVLIQTDGILRGEYRDQLDRSIGLIGTYDRPDFAIVVDFGDAKLNLEGTLRNAREADGTMFTSALGNQTFSFAMSR